MRKGVPKAHNAIEIEMPMIRSSIYIYIYDDISLSAMSRKCYSIMASKCRLSKRRAQDRKRGRERRTSETAAQREVRLAKRRL